MHQVQTFLLAAAERFKDGQALLLAGRSDAACYMAGYVIEMTLKHAAVTAAGAGPTDGSAIWRNFFWTMGKQGQIAAPFQGGHGIDFWSEALLLQRGKGQLGILDGERSAGLEAARQHANKLWNVEMRYAAAQRSDQDAQQLLQSAGWLLQNHQQLIA